MNLIRIPLLLGVCATWLVAADNAGLKLQVYTGTELRQLIDTVRLKHAAAGGGPNLQLAGALNEVAWESVISVDPCTIRISTPFGTETLSYTQLSPTAQDAFGFSAQSAARFLEMTRSGELADAMTKTVKKKVPYNLATKPEGTYRKVLDEILAQKAKAKGEDAGAAKWKIFQHIEGDSYLAHDEKGKNLVRLDLSPGSKQHADGSLVTVKATKTPDLHEYKTVQNAKKRIPVYRESESETDELGGNIDGFIQRLKAGHVETFEVKKLDVCTFCDGAGEIESGVNPQIIPCRRCNGKPKTMHVTVYEVHWKDVPAPALNR